MGAAANHRRRERCEVAIKSGIASVVLLGTAYRAMGAEQKALAHNQLLQDAIQRVGVKEGVLIDVAQPKSSGPFTSLIYQNPVS